MEDISQSRAGGPVQLSKNYSASQGPDVTKTRRIVLLGKTGSGKSSLGNTIFGENVFKIGHTHNSETRECQAETRSVNGRSITLIDTPGFFDTHMSEEELKTEIVRCITECVPGPHALLIVLRVERFATQENYVIRKISEYFSEEAFKYAAVVLTQGDQLPEGMKIEEFVQQNQGLCDLVRKCGGRCHVVDNKYWKHNQQDEYRSNQFQVAELLNTIDKIVEENKGGGHTNEMLQTVDSMIKKHGKSNVSNFLKMSAGITTGVLLGALLGVPIMIGIVVKALKKMKPPIAAEAARLVVGAALKPGLGAAAGGTAGTGLGIAVGVAAATGAVVGGSVGYREAEKANSVGEAAKNTANTIWDETLQRFKN